MGGSSEDDVCLIGVGDSGEVVVSGITSSSDFSVTNGAYDTYHSGGIDGFVTKLDSSLSSAIASTFIGGSGDDYACSLAVGPSGAVYITGHTSNSGFPVTSGAYDSTYNGEIEVFVAKLDVSLSRTVYYYIPHVAHSAIWWSALGIENIGSTDATLSFLAYDRDGNFLEKSSDIIIPPMGNKAVEVASIFGGNLPNGATCLSISSSGGQIRGFELFGTWDMRRSAYVPIFSEGADELYFTHIAETDKWGTGIAIQNIGCGDASVRFIAYDEDGGFLGQSGVFDIPVMGNLVSTVSAIFNGLVPPGTASLRVVSTGGELVGFEFFGTLDGEILTGLPATMR